MNRITKHLAILLSLTVLVLNATIVSFPVYAEDTEQGVGIECKIPDATTTPAGCWDDFFGSNDIIYYDPNAEVCYIDGVLLNGDGSVVLPGAENPTDVNSGPLAGNSNAEKAWIYLGNKGLTAEQIAGILGNLYEESSIDPAVEQGGRIITDPNYKTRIDVGFGIAQWTFRSRQLALEAYAASTGRAMTDLSMQLDFLWQEFGGSPSLADLKAQNTPESAAISFHTSFEKSADNAAGIQERANAARMFYEQYKNLSSTAEGTGTADSGAATNINSESTGPGSAFALTCEANKAKAEAEEGTGAALPSSPMHDSFTLFTQCGDQLVGGRWGDIKDPQGSSVCKSGSIPTALAIIAKNIGGQNVNPTDTINYYTESNLWSASGGSLLNSPVKAASHFGLKATPILNKGDIAAYRKVFKAGGVVMTISTGSSPFTSNRHPIILRGITNEGNFMITDPGQTDTNFAPLNQPSVNKILTDVRSDEGSVSYAFYKK